MFGFKYSTMYAKADVSNTVLVIFLSGTLDCLLIEPQVEREERAAKEAEQLARTQEESQARQAAIMMLFGVLAFSNP